MRARDDPGLQNDPAVTPVPLVSKPWPAAAIAGVFALLCASGIPGLGDTDPYRHLATAAEVWRTRFALRGLPFLPFTLLGDTGVDL
ncbi:MAG: hypothetical protein NVS2B9_18000 [Myxococcales bacterium]